jgi:TonB-linked SusC/RagA family outer membrane protein
MRKFVLLCAAAMLCSVVVLAQTRKISGVVTDANGKAVPFASVTIKGTNNGTAADANGKYTLSNVKAGDVLVVTSLGFLDQETPVGSSDVINITFTGPKSENLTEIVVSTALGIRKQPRELGYSTARVSNSEFTAANAVNVQNGLTGKVSGLNISTVNNGVFADTRITLRGIRSLTGNNQPLLVLDGSPVSLSMLNNLNPNDIEDITVLKGASSASLYGPDGVNGVIFVKTKRGTKSGAPVVTVSNSTQFETVLFMPKFQSHFGSGSSVDANGFGVYDPIENQQYGDEFDGSIREIGKPLPDGSIVKVPYQYAEDGRRNFFQTGVTLQNDISYAAKDFYMSIQDARITGTMKGDDNRRTTFRFNSGREYGKFNANYNLSYTRGEYEVASVSPYWEVFNTPGQIDLGEYEDWRNDPKASPNHYFNEYYQNPYFIKDRSRSKGTSDDIFAQVELGFKVNKWLNLTYRASTTMFNSDYKNTSEAFTFSDYAKNVTHKYNASNDYFASVSDGEARSNRLTSDFFITGQKDFGDFSIDGLVGHSFRQTTAKSIGVSGSNLIIPTLYNVVNRTGEPGASESNSKTRAIGVFGKVALGYKNWAFVEFTGRNDWDSRLPQGALSFFYPGASVSLVLSEALDFIKNSNFISYLKIRGSYNKSGNVNVGAYALEPVYSPAGGFPYGSLPGFQGSLSVTNPLLKPEFVHSREAGIEISFLKSRINLEVTGYFQYNTDQIIGVQTSRTTGYSTATVNAADFDNKGLEFDLKLTPLLSLGNFRFDLKTNLSLLDSKVNEVYGETNELGIGNGNFAIVGHPAYVFKLTDYKRNDQGKIIVDRITGYPSLDPDPKMFGRTMPKVILGINPTFSYQGLTLMITADYRGGHQVYHGIGSDMDFTGSSYRSGTNGRQRFIVPNSVYDDGTGKYVENTSVLVANGGYGYYEGTNTNRGVNSNYLTSAAAWKIREAVLSYTLPGSLVKKAKVIKRAEIGVTARNLFTFRPESNQWTDPEFANTTGNALGVNNNTILPPTRLIGFNITLNF